MGHRRGGCRQQEPRGPGQEGVDPHSCGAQGGGLEAGRLLRYPAGLAGSTVNATGPCVRGVRTGTSLCRWRWSWPSQPLLGVRSNVWEEKPRQRGANTILCTPADAEAVRAPRAACPGGRWKGAGAAGEIPAGPPKQLGQRLDHLRPAARSRQHAPGLCWAPTASGAGTHGRGPSWPCLMAAATAVASAAAALAGPATAAGDAGHAAAGGAGGAGVPGRRGRAGRPRSQGPWRRGQTGGGCQRAFGFRACSASRFLGANADGCLARCGRAAGLPHDVRGLHRIYAQDRQSREHWELNSRCPRFVPFDCTKGVQWSRWPDRLCGLWRARQRRPHAQRCGGCLLPLAIPFANCLCGSCSVCRGCPRRWPGSGRADPACRAEAGRVRLRANTGASRVAGRPAKCPLGIAHAAGTRATGARDPGHRKACTVAVPAGAAAAGAGARLGPCGLPRQCAAERAHEHHGRTATRHLA